MQVSKWNGRCGSYGPIYVVSLGSVSAVVLNNMCTISDAFESKAHIFSDRPNWLPLMSLIYRERGISKIKRSAVPVRSGTAYRHFFESRTGVPVLPQVRVNFEHFGETKSTIFACKAYI